MKIIIIIILLAFIILALSFLLTFIMYRMQFGKRIDICEADKKSDIPRRKKIEFYSGKNKLTGYFYGINQNKVNNKVVLVVNGYGVTYNAYMPEICELINCGDLVFSYDMTGCGESEGENIKGFAQFIIDAQNAVLYLKKQGLDKIIAFGHSTGAYAVAALLNIQKENLNKAIIISAFDVPNKFVRMCMQKKMKCFAYLLQFWIAVFEKIQFGKYALLSGKDGVNKYQKPVLIIQGAKDDQVEVNNSLYSLRKDVINNQAEFLLEKNRGHYPTRIENEKDIVINKEIFEVIKEYIKDT